MCAELLQFCLHRKKWVFSFTFANSKYRGYLILTPLFFTLAYFGMMKDKHERKKLIKPCQSQVKGNNAIFFWLWDKIKQNKPGNLCSLCYEVKESESWSVMN